MKVISRKPGQAIIIGQDIGIKIIRITGNTVAIGIEVPDNVYISRLEQWLTQDSGKDTIPATAPVTSRNIDYLEFKHSSKNRKL